VNILRALALYAPKMAQRTDRPMKSMFDTATLRVSVLYAPKMAQRTDHPMKSLASKKDTA
jgi:hypothetical protein